VEPVICLLKADLSSVSIVGWHKLPAHVETGIPVEAHIAQSVEHFLGKEEVIGSNPIVSTISFPYGRVMESGYGGVRKYSKYNV
jgi:hypothetical protein